MRTALIVNSGSGTVRKEQVDEAFLRELARQAGLEAEVHLVPGERITETAQRALESGVEALVAGGGDGTIRAVAAVLAGGDRPLGVLPVGTMNHFARDLGIPLDLAEALRLVATGTVRRLDLGEVNGEVFVNNSSLGFYPPLVRVRDRERRERERGKWTATVVAALKVLPRLPSLRVEVEMEGRTVVHDTWFVFIGNNEYEMSLFSYGARSRLDSGDLYMYIAKPRSRLGLVGLALLGIVRDVTATDSFDCFRLPELTIRTDKKILPVYLDGEVTLLQPPLRYRTRVRDLPVILPPASTS